MVVLVMFCAQGDNTPEALELASLLDTWLKLKNNSVSLAGQECL